MRVELIDLSKSYGTTPAVQNLNLILPEGGITAFLGPNGAGKTTTMKMMVGLLKPSSGSILMDGCDFSKDQVRLKRQIAYIPDFPFLYERLTGREFLEFIAGVYGIPPRDVMNRITAAVERFELPGMLDHLVRQYSHGMRQRLVFCAALIRNPDLLIIDEPMVGLDPKTSRIFKDTLLELSGRGVTVFLSTHQLAVAEELAGSIAIIHHGRLLQYGRLPDIQSREGIYRNLEHYFLELTDGQA